MRDFSRVDAAIWTSDPADVALQRAIGPWSRITPRDAGEILADFDRPWWVVGGYAIEAFTGVTREHRDIDIEFFRDDVAGLRAALSGRYDLWSVGSGLLRLMDAENPGLHPHSRQIWIREHAWAPWMLDLLAGDGGGGEWVHRRDARLRGPLAEVTWTDQDGIRYLAPDLVLSFKVGSRNSDDHGDFAAAVDRLSDDGRGRLRDFIRRNSPHHPWLSRLG